MDFIFGIILCGLIGTAAMVLHLVIPLGAVTISLLSGMIFANTVKVPSRAGKGVAYTEKNILYAAIALLGFSLDYNILFSLGLFPLVLVLTGVPVTILTALLLGRLFGLEKNLALLVGTGNGICGSSAIASAQAVINAKEEHVGVSIAVINLLGTIGILILPLITSLFPGLSDKERGMAIGNTLQAVGQVTAAGFSLGSAAGQTSVIIKMGRILLISPVILIYSLFRKEKQVIVGSSTSKIIKVPPFILFFIFFSLINTFINIPAVISQMIIKTEHVLLVIAMAGIGMKISLKGIVNEGQQALLVGAGTWIIQIGYTLLLLLIFA